MDLNQKIPAYLNEKGNIVKLIFFTALFALVFINLYSPFGVTARFENTKFGLLLGSSLVILTGVLVVVISRVILYQVNRFRGSITLAQYLLWIAAEVFSMSMFYALYDKLFLGEMRPFWDSYKISIRNTALVLLLPYSVLWLYFSWIDKNKQIQQLSGTAEGPAPDQKEMIPFRDEKGTMRITVKTNDLLYLQAADNYVTIFYNNQQKQAKYLLRSSLKQIETELKESSLIRCHRSYMVNFEKVKIIRREKDGLMLELDSVIPIEIPVSKTYMDEVFKAFGQDSR